MPLVFRAMYREGDKPKAGDEKNCLGVRVPPEPHADVHPDHEGYVGQGEGMSVAPNWRDLPFFLVPIRLNRMVPKANGQSMRVDIMAGKFRDNHHYLQMVDLLQQLHALMCQGRGDTEDAERLREEMEVPWRHLTDEERNRIEGLSADLYTLESASPITHPLEPGIYAEELAEEVRKAREAGDYDRVLALLRSHPAEISADRAATLRAFSYERLGEQKVAVQFLEHAVRVSSSPDSYAVLLLSKLLQFGEHERALGWARKVSRIVDDPSAQWWSKSTPAPIVVG